MLFLFCVALWFILRGASCFKVFLCSLSSSFVIPFSIMITSLGEDGAGLCGSRAFVFLFCACWFLSFFFFLLVSGVGCGLWLWHTLGIAINLLYRSRFLVSCTILWFGQLSHMVQPCGVTAHFHALTLSRIGQCGSFLEQENIPPLRLFPAIWVGSHLFFAAIESDLSTVG